MDPLCDQTSIVLVVTLLTAITKDDVIAGDFIFFVLLIAFQFHKLSIRKSLDPSLAQWVWRRQTNSDYYIIKTDAVRIWIANALELTFLVQQP